jgi:hypothetical protein
VAANRAGTVAVEMAAVVADRLDNAVAGGVFAMVTAAKVVIELVVVVTA